MVVTSGSLQAATGGGRKVKKRKMEPKLTPAMKEKAAPAKPKRGGKGMSDMAKLKKLKI